MSDAPKETEMTAPKSPPKEPRSKAGWLALLFTLALVGWMGSGYYAQTQAPAASETQTPRQNKNPFTVQAFESKARPVTQFVAAEGQAKPDRETPVRAKVGGTIESIEVRKGDFLEEGALIGRIALADRAAQVAQAEAELSRRQSEFNRIEDLVSRGYATRAEIEESTANLAVAQSALASIRQTSGDTEIRAPITGVLEDFNLAIGEFISSEAEVGTQVDTDPLTVDIEVVQQSIGRLRTGQEASVTFITGETRVGEVTYVATNANASTRTFPVEITIPNPKRDIPAGVSAQVRIPVGETPAHFLSAAILALGSDGELGVKAVNDDATVAFYPAQLVRAETDGIWVSGLPDSVRIISVGQGFVSEGERVNPVAPSDDTRLAPEEPRGEDADPRAISAGVPNAPAVSEDAAEAAAEAASASQEAPQGSGLMAPTGQRGPPDAASATNDEAARAADILQTAAITGQIDAGGDRRGEVIRLAQQALASLGYDPGPVDGVLGSSTRSAIRAFQSDTGLEATGDISSAVAQALALAIGTEDTR